MPTTRHNGFTAVEVFLVLTMLALVVGLMVVPAYRLLDAFKVRPLETTILSTIRQAHRLSRSENCAVILNYQSTSNRFQLCTQEGYVLGTVTLHAQANEQDEGPEIAFYRLLPEDPKGDGYVYEREDEPVPTVAFYPYGVSTPFAVQFTDGADDTCLIMDPCSGKPVMRLVNGDES
jgi:Tfp pilus assembly protein FimT